MRILDRYIIRSIVFNYVLALRALLVIVILLDLVVNFESFTRPVGTAPTSLSVLGDILGYYLYQLLIFQQVSFAVPLLAVGFTMVGMTRRNELNAMLATGVSIYRVATPIVVVSTGFSLVTVVIHEFVVSQPLISHPVMNLIMLFIGIPFILTRGPNHPIKNNFYCIAAYGLVIGATFAIFQVAGSTLPGGYKFSTLVATWIPIFLFGPLSFVMIGRIKT